MPLHAQAGREDAFNERLQRDLEKTVWADPSAHSWYKNEHGRKSFAGTRTTQT